MYEKIKQLRSVIDEKGVVTKEDMKIIMKEEKKQREEIIKDYETKVKNLEYIMKSRFQKRKKTQFGWHNCY